MRKLTIWLMMFYVAFTVGSPTDTSGSFGSVTKFLSILVGISYLVSKIESPKLRTPARYMAALVAFFAWNLASMIWTLDPALGFNLIWRFFVSLTAAFILWDSCRSEDDLLVALEGLVGAGYLIFYQLYKNYSAGMAHFGQDRFSAEGMSPNFVAMILSIATSAAWFIVLSKRPISKIFLPINYMMPLIAIYGVVLTGSRGGAICLLVALFPILLSIWRKPFGVIGLSGAAILALPALMTSTSIQNNLARITSMTESGSSDQFSGRLDLWTGAIQSFMRAPFTGTGIGGYSAISTALGYNTSSGVTGAHQSFLGTASDSGIVGLVLLIVMTVSVFQSVRYFPSDLRIVAYGVFFSILIGMFSSHIQYSVATIFPFTLVAVGSEIFRFTMTSAKRAAIQREQAIVPAAGAGSPGAVATKSA